MNDISRELIEEAQTGSLKAFEDIYKSASGFVYNVALRITNNRQEAQEVAQDVFLKIYHNLKDFQFRSSFKTWAYRITVNTALNASKRAFRLNKGRQDLESVIDTHPASETTEKDLVDREEGKIRSEQIKALLAMLNPDQRACIVLREMEGLSYEEIAKTLNININTVRSRLKRARETLLNDADRKG